MRGRGPCFDSRPSAASRTAASCRPDPHVASHSHARACAACLSSRTCSRDAARLSLWDRALLCMGCASVMPPGPTCSRHPPAGRRCRTLAAAGPRSSCSRAPASTAAPARVNFRIHDGCTPRTKPVAAGFLLSCWRAPASTATPACVSFQMMGELSSIKPVAAGFLPPAPTGAPEVDASAN